MKLLTRLHLISLSGLLTIGGAGGISYALHHHFKTEAESLSSLASQRTLAIESLNRELGYSGMIHDIENYMLRADPKYRDRFYNKMSSAQKSVAEYRQIRGISEFETDAIDAIEAVLDNYESTMASIDASGHEHLGAESFDAHALDSSLRFDDATALAGLSILNTSRDRLYEQVTRTHSLAGTVTPIATLLATLAGVLAYTFLFRRLSAAVTSPVVHLGGGELDSLLASRFIEGTPVPIALLDEEDRIITASPSWYETFGDTDEPGTTKLDGHVSLETDAWDRAVEECMNGVTAHIDHCEVTDNTGDSFQARVSVRRWDDASGSRHGTIVSIASIQRAIDLESDLSHADERFEAAIEGTSDGFWDWPDVDKDEEWWSPQFYHLLGYKPGEIKASFSSFKELLHPDFHQTVKNATSEALAGGKPFDQKYLLRMKSGAYRWFRGRGKVFVSDFRPTRMAGSIQDVHESIIAQNHIDRQRHELRLILDSMPSYIFYKDDSNTIINLNKAAAESIGLPVEEIIGRNTADFFPQEVAEAYLADDLSILERGRPRLGYEEPFETSNLGKRVIRTDKFPLHDEHGCFTRILAIVSDVTEDREMQEKLRTLSERLTLSLESAKQAAWDWNLVTGEVVFSDTWYTMLGYEPGELPMSYQTWHQLVDPDHLPDAKTSIKACLAGETDHFECTIRMKNRAGDWQWVRTIGRAVGHDDNGNPTRIAGMHIDVDEIKQTQVELEDKNAEMEHFVYTASHDLKSPIVTVLGYASRILKDYEQGHAERISDSVARIIRAGERMRMNIDALLNLSRIGRVEQAARPITLSSAIDCALEQFAQQIEEQSVQIDQRIGEERVIAAPAYLDQIMANLLGNALKYGCAAENPCITIGCEQDEEDVVISIDDNGDGIPEEHAERVFGIFERLSSDKDGTGIGLAIVKRAAEISGGDAWVEANDQGQGAKIRIRLPKAKPETNTVDSTIEANQAGRKVA